jgi:nucleoside 2-deoxyribosyltransferase
VSKKIYLANPYGFSEASRRLLLPEIKTALESMGLVVLEPFERCVDFDWSLPETPSAIGQQDLQDIRLSDAIFAVCNGNPPDEGVMVELGYAIALRKQTFLFRDDIRRCSDTDTFPLNLMLFTGVPYKAWVDYYYTLVGEIMSKEKALYKWAVLDQIT